MNTKSPKYLTLLTTIWVLLILAGFWWVMDYQTKPGTMAIPEENKVALDHSKDSWHLIAFLHPECTCSRATMEELDILQKKLGNTLSTHIFISTELPLEQTVESEIYRTAVKNKNWQVDVDVNAELATQMLAYTSGICYLYSPEEKLIFAGGITASRGHSGPAAGQEIIAKAVSGNKEAIQELQQYPVYGCGIHDKAHLVISKL